MRSASRVPRTPAERRQRGEFRALILFALFIALSLAVIIPKKLNRSFNLNLNLNPLAGTPVIDSLNLVNPLTIEVNQGTHGRILEFSSEDCASLHEDECGEGKICLVDENVEGACCLTSDPANISSSVCLTKAGDRCDFDELCLAELVPGSNVGVECLSPFEISAGAVIYFLLMFYLFIGLAIVCDDYFTECLDRLADMLGMSSDVKGATFAAIGSSAPELFVSLADNVISNPPKSVGVGTIVGSAIFNILIIIGLSAIAAGRYFGSLQLDWRPLARDSLFYTISIVALVVTAITGNRALYYEGLILLLIYASYLVFMMYNQRIFDQVDALLGTSKTKDLSAIDPAGDDTEKELPDAVDGGPVAVMEDDVATLDAQEKKAESFANMKKRSSIASALGKGSLQGKTAEEVAATRPPYFENLYIPRKKADQSILGYCWSLFYYMLVFPINLAFRLTIPDTTYDIFREDKEVEVNGEVVVVRDRRKIGYWVGFFMSVVHIAIFSQLLVFSASKFGCLAGIPPPVMGLTFLAAGTSIPDAITSIVLTRHGEGDAAVANSIGSNVFDILVGLGLPWFLAGLIYGEAAIATDDIVVSIIFLFGVLIVLLGGLVFTKFVMNTKFGVFLVLLYVAYVVYALLSEN